MCLRNIIAMHDSKQCVYEMFSSDYSKNTEYLRPSTADLVNDRVADLSTHNSARKQTMRLIENQIPC